jgi:hypothetical protein
MMKFFSTVLFTCFLAACAPQHSAVKNFDWSGVNTVTLAEFDDNVWHLRPLVEQEVTDLGFRILEPGPTAPDLQISFSGEQVADIAESGSIIYRLRTLQLQLRDGSGQTELYRSHYALSSSQHPRQGIRRLFAELRRQIHATAPETAPGVVGNDASAPAPPEDRAATAGTSAPASRPVTTPTNPPEQQPEQSPGAKPSGSSWLPRFQGWGFSDWGTSPDTAE